MKVMEAVIVLFRPGHDTCEPSCGRLLQQGDHRAELRGDAGDRGGDGGEGRAAQHLPDRRAQRAQTLRPGHGGRGHAARGHGQHGAGAQEHC